MFYGFLMNSNSSRFPASSLSKIFQKKKTENKKTHSIGSDGDLFKIKTITNLLGKPLFCFFFGLFVDLFFYRCCCWFWMLLTLWRFKCTFDTGCVSAGARVKVCVILSACHNNLTLRILSILFSLKFEAMTT